ncbi:AraC family transcriptional regulator [Chlorogloeopsis sp. ULAP01]|uniref:helix-turn-helix domain-containing protein n=1 Tax=Chlorogloeopsis sp. ULAP01 TaxID=3056483 RepID=UPI0025AA9749|nr:AraC family transcriptional regulator [Chlorogloeopsis sp. ULAP01]MDM9379245.1 AraC family transcriptional regulator [Chlorogloeopsis sp. ULAP01]
MPKEKSFLSSKFKDIYHLPRLPLISSQPVGWSGINLEYHCQPPHETPNHIDAAHEINIPIFKHPQQIECAIDGHHYNKCISSGEIAIVPAKVFHSLSWNLEIECITLSVEPALIALTAYESIDPDRVEITPQFAKADPLVYQIGLALKSVLETDKTGSRLYAESAATMLAVHLLRHYSAKQHCIQEYAAGLPKYKLRQAVEYINEHLAEDLSLDAIASQVGMSRYYFAHLFKQSMGVSVHQYVIRQRVEYAKQLLLHSNLNVTEVAFQAGFANPSHLSHHFKRLVGVTPKIFLRK